MSAFVLELTMSVTCCRPWVLGKLWTHDQADDTGPAFIFTAYLAC